MSFGLSQNTVERIRTVFASFPQVKKVILYGSRAKGNYRPGSDIDLTLIGTSMDLQTLNQIRTQLEGLPTPYTFDLSIFQDIENQELIEHIERVGLVFYEA